MKELSPRIIGGKIGFPENFPTQQGKPGFLSGNPILLFNARSGIKLVLEALKPGQVWLPSYLCPSIISAVLSADTEFSFYPVDQLLNMEDSWDISRNIRSGDLVVVIDYFGFPFNQLLIEELKNQGCLILRDCSQALFYAWYEDALCDYFLFSPRKFLAVPDGGVLISKENKELLQTHLQEAGEDVMFTMLKALLLRRDFDILGGERKFLELFEQGERRFAPGTLKMSQLTHMLLTQGFDYHQIQTQRRTNFRILLKELGSYALFHQFPDNVVPLGFPIRVNNRNEIRNKLFQKNIFPAIHWDLKVSVPRQFVQSHQLSEEIMTLPCDQRYNEEDMHYVAQSVLELAS